MRTAPLHDKVRILMDGWPVVLVKEPGVLTADERRHAMVALSAAVLGRGGLYGMILDLQHAELLSVVDREIIVAFGRATSHNCRAVAALTPTASGPVTAMLWARALRQDVILVGSVPEGMQLCRRALGLSSPADSRGLDSLAP